MKKNQYFGHNVLIYTSELFDVAKQNVARDQTFNMSHHTRSFIKQIMRYGPKTENLDLALDPDTLPMPIANFLNKKSKTRNLF